MILCFFLYQKYNFHSGAWAHRNALHYLFAPQTNLQNLWDMASLKRLSQRYVDINLERSESRHNTAKAVHDELERLLAPPSEEHWPRRTFFDEPRVKPAPPPAPEEEEKEADPAE